MNEWASEQVNEQMIHWMKELVKKQMSEQVN